MTTSGERLNPYIREQQLRGTTDAVGHIMQSDLGAVRQVKYRQVCDVQMQCYVGVSQSKIGWIAELESWDRSILQ